MSLCLNKRTLELWFSTVLDLRLKRPWQQDLIMQRELYKLLGLTNPLQALLLLLQPMKEHKLLLYFFSVHIYKRYHFKKVCLIYTYLFFLLFNSLMISIIIKYSRIAIKTVRQPYAVYSSNSFGLRKANQSEAVLGSNPIAFTLYTPKRIVTI
jgi:hypothetical protein